MQDQVNNLTNKGIKALCLYSGMSYREIDITLDNAVYGDYKFLYVSPERLKTDIFIERFKKMKVNFIAIDEAHCISQWGYDFRPAYLKIAELRLIKKDLNFIAVTATATPPVVKDIQEQLGFKSDNTFKSSFVRSNLKYLTFKTDNKLDDIIGIVKKLKGSGIIYCGTRKDTKTIHQHLINNNESTDFYHGGLDKDIRQLRQSNWMKNKTRIMVSTNAFGMGIDKPDVRFVIHYHTPENIESYFQEAGRAGRDQKPARAILYFNNSDLSNIKERVNSKFPDIATIKAVYNALGNHFQLAIGSGKDEMFSLNLADFSVKYNLNLRTTYNTIKLLENSGLISFNDSNYTQSRMKILVDKVSLYQHQVRNKKHDQIIQFILRSHLGLFDEYLQINEVIIAKKLNLSTKEISESLNHLNKQQVVDYIPHQSGYQIIYLTERLNDNNFTIPKAFYQSKKEAAILKATAIHHFLENNECRQTFILNYFGLPESQICGQCNVCLNVSVKSPSKSIADNTLKFIESKSKTTSLPIDLIQNNFDQYSNSEIIQTINWLNEQGKIDIDASGKTVQLTKKDK